MVLPKQLTLPAEALARMVALENLGEPHVTLKPAAVWRPKHVEHEVETRTRAEFARMGLFDRRGRLDVELVASLAVLCRAGAEFYGWISDGGKTKGVLAAAIGREAILAIRDGDSVTLQQIRPESLPEALVGQTKDVPPGRGEPFSLMRSEALASVGGRQRTEAGVGTRPASAEVRLAQKIAELPTTGGGQLFVVVRDGGTAWGAAGPPRTRCAMPTPTAVAGSTRQPSSATASTGFSSPPPAAAISCSGCRRCTAR